MLRRQRMQNKTKHSKIRNSGLLFEFLLRQITLDVLNKHNSSNAVKMIKENFNENTRIVFAWWLDHIAYQHACEYYGKNKFFNR